MSMLKDFRAFAVKGNVVDLAVGVIIGGAFGKIVESMVQDIIMPVVGKIFGGLDFASYYIPLNGQPYGLSLVEAKKAGAVFAYGNFVTILINFVILAFIIFQMIRIINKARDLTAKQEEAAPAAPAEDVLLLREIRDALKK
ncbi:MULTISPECIES: large conductance mechanosensitive channel protein MscL [unclassified Herbaspirillum]|uniref:large conductance mechanosensitive channel protein MscL n=1 Tax=unclassified Herbaspirillum TaxID=2624150 RepID=UPI00114F66BA|nr:MULTISPECIES: large conductance mechanosensitive channel protein MscL [unclassified Herbaspirillum]MBB5390403.1 large conductance mechanosensitive channel [Herbaspirillum sp. SJZ102]TQK09100.1 large conductance mechanosensitive channel [Herbaspirillum sp. SJZ130]TQK14213.1 large conductance mechanosensitive channel [Herbaspirillum sp. SJZ106]TWC69912.1 large conductance mechanosensitive channel [Herbaspirillum sp. SJZ099]